MHFSLRMQYSVCRIQYSTFFEIAVYLTLGLTAECILGIFERTASNLGQSANLPRPLNRAGKPYGKSSYHLASFNKPFNRKSLPLGYRWPSFEPNPHLDCDSTECQSPSKSKIK